MDLAKYVGEEYIELKKDTLTQDEINYITYHLITFPQFFYKPVEIELNTYLSLKMSVSDLAFLTISDDEPNIECEVRLLILMLNYYKPKYQNSSEEEKKLVAHKIATTNMKKIAWQLLKKHFSHIQNINFKIEAIIETMLKTNILSEYIIHKDDFEELETYAVDQNIISLPIYLKAIKCQNSQALFLENLLNTFQNLNISNKNGKIRYKSYSQSFTTYCLRQLAKKGIIDIETSEYSTTANLSIHENMYGTQKNKELYSMYTTIFYKKRDITINDLPFINSLLNILKAGELKTITRNHKLYFKAPKKELEIKELNNNIKKISYAMSKIITELAKAHNNTLIEKYIENDEHKIVL